mgnify:CR=1 FL=1
MKRVRRWWLVVDDHDRVWATEMSERSARLTRARCMARERERYRVVEVRPVRRGRKR